MIFHSQKDCGPFLELMTANFGKGQKHVIRFWQNDMPCWALSVIRQRRHF